MSNQDTFYNAYPNKEIYFTECSGTMGSDWWSDIKVRPHIVFSFSEIANIRPLSSGTSITCRLRFSSYEKTVLIFSHQVYWRY